MMRKSVYIPVLLAGIYAGWTGCKRSYTPVIRSGNVNYLVVEGVIDPGSDSTIIKLSRAVKLNSKKGSAAETGARVTVEGNNGQNYIIPEIGNGKYAAPSLGLDSTQQYRLRIKTADGKQYVSDFAAAKPTPPIDSIGYTVKSNGIQVYVNTHDPKNNTYYYRWDYAETWEFHAEYLSLFVSNGTAIVKRDADQMIYYCYASDTSANITLGSSAKLQRDVIYQDPLVFIPSTSEKIEQKYSILVKQYALTKDAYNYWQQLKKNTEQLGSIFDAQPSEIQGNIHCTSDPVEPVIGFVSVSSVKQKRVFIDNRDLPRWAPVYPYDCKADTQWYCRQPGCVNDVAENLIPLPTSKIPLSAVLAPDNITILAYLASSAECADCTIRGVHNKPDFWK
ncbi:MAG TPA: DUF4249 domain-containing protein [Mucilaginibacter sp.]|nr:DUF4249 domain-containing protein [Mucilaginibacter sp.]